MNDLLQKLTQKTDVWCDQNYHNDPYYDLHWEKKFAELIIAETISTIHRTATLNDCEFIGGMIADSVKEHFTES